MLVIIGINLWPLIGSMTLEQLASYDPLQEIRNGKPRLLTEAKSINLEKQAITDLKIQKCNEVATEIADFLGIKALDNPYYLYKVFIVDSRYFIFAEPRDNQTYIYISTKSISYGFNVIEWYKWPYRGDFFFEKNYIKAKTKLKNKIRARLLQLLTENS